MRYYVIVNPISGRGRGEKSIPQIESSLRESGLDFTLVRTERMWHAADLAEGAVRDGYNVIVCASGDGTVNESINGIMRVKKISIKSLDKTFPAHADGEFICLNGSALTLELFPLELEIVYA
jgi:hypothetical protein